MLRFDAYTATTKGASHHQLAEILTGVGNGGKVAVKEGRGMHTFGHRLGFRDESGDEFGQVMWGGAQQYVYFEVKGERTPEAVEALRARFWHRVTRVDSCADFDAPGAFERLLGPCLSVKKAHRLKGSKLGDWEDFPDEGRTLYLGSPASVSRVRLYEKGKQPGYTHLERPNWARLEAQIRPAKEAKESFNSITPAGCWGASRWTRDLAAQLLSDHVDPHPAGTVYKLSERERALRWMCKQYGSHLLGLAADVGSWECVGLTLAEILKEQAKGR